MFGSYFKVAFRNLLKRKVSTFIQVIGLAVGLACCTLVAVYFRRELSFDRGFEGSGQIYRVTSDFKDGALAPTTSWLYGTLLRQEIPEIAKVSRLDAKNSPCIVKAADDTAAIPYFEWSGYWVDPNFFDLFSYHFLYGDRKTALIAPNTIVLSDSTAHRLFHGVYPLGKRVRAGSIVYTVSGVFRAEGPDHLDAGFFASNNSTGIREQMARIVNWVSDPNYYTYVRLKPGADVHRVIDKLHAYTQRHAAADLKRTGHSMVNSLQPLYAIHLNSSQYYDYMSNRVGDLRYLYLLISIAVAILLLACINYMNLSTAQALDRAREVGVRRVLGAEKKAIRGQFLIETMVVSLLAMVLGLGLAVLFLPEFNGFTGQQLAIFTAENLGLIGCLLPIALLTGLLAGVYPAVYLSSFRPVKVLKRKVSDSGALLNVRKVLVVGQFAVATGLLFGTIVIWKQLQYMMTARTGVDDDQQLVIRMFTEESTKNVGYYMQQLKADPRFQSVAGATDPMMAGDMNLYPAEKTVESKRDIYLDYVGENYLSSLGLKLIAGTGFTPATFTNTNMKEPLETSDIGRQVILNEEAVKALGYTVSNVVGKTLAHVHDSTIYRYTVMGVMKDYHYFSLHAPIGPMALMPVNPRRFATIIAKVRGRDMEGAYRYAMEKWRTINGDTPFLCDLLSNVFRYDYATDRRQQQMMSAFTIIAILISCLGVLGLITYTVGQKAREIGIRKVIGASVADIVFLFARQYLRLILVANLIAAPIGWYLMQQWLRPLAYHIDISWWMFAVALGMGCMVTFATLSVKTIRAALANPVDALRGE
jgi:putative ABC transport system permease protein